MSSLAWVYAAVALFGLSHGAPIFGTTNGYDVGGTDPMCWTSELPPEKEITGKTNDIEQLNELTFQNSTTTSPSELGRLLPECYAGTSMTLRPVSYGLSQMIIGEDFTFELVLQADLKTFLTGVDSIENVIGPKSTIHVRLQLCDALQQGFCNPIRDTRAKDSALTRDQTDVRVSTTSSSNQSDPFAYPEGENKWSYNESDVLWGIPDRTTVSARWCKWALRPIEESSTIYRSSLNITMRLPDIREGAYFFVGHAVMNFQVGDKLERVDVAQTIPGNVVEVRRPPKILRLTKSMERGVLAVLLILGVMSLAVFGATIYHKDHPVMSISQGPLLSALSFAATLQIASVYTALPLSNFACRVNGLAVLLPMTLLGSLLVGRMWRMYTTLSSVSSLGRLSKEPNHSLDDSNKPIWNCNDFMLQILGMFADIPSLCRRTPRGGRRNSLVGLRRKVTLQQTLSLVGFLVLPQVIYQTIVTIISERSLIVEFDSEQRVGREVCSHRFAGGTGMALALIVFMIALWLATMSRNLPSAFNEKEHIFLVSSICATLSFVTLSILGLTDTPSSPPDVNVFLQAVLFLGIAVSVIVLVVWPKLRRVLSGEKVVMSKLLDCRFSASDTFQRGSSSHDEHTQTLPITRQRKAIALNEPLPSDIEEHILGTQNLLRDMSSKFEKGQPITTKEWDSMRSLIHDLNFDICSVDVFEDAVPSGKIRRMSEC